MAAVSTVFNKAGKENAMNALISKLTVASAAISAFLMVSPAHANLAIPIMNQVAARTDLTMLESLKPISMTGELFVENETAVAHETELSAKLNQMNALRHLMRSA